MGDHQFIDTAGSISSYITKHSFVPFLFINISMFVYFVNCYFNSLIYITNVLIFQNAI